MSRDRSLYDVLGVAPDADAREVRRAYLAMARRHHPDRDGGDDTSMRRVNEAWATLGDPIRRHQYDLVLRRPNPRPGPTWAAGSAGPSGMASERQPIDDLLDDRPVRITIQLPRWLSMLPPGLFGIAVVLFAGGALFGSTFVALGIMALLASLLLFVASPFVALYASRRAHNR